MIQPAQSVASVVLDHPECASILQRNRIDYCCRGEISIAEACAQKKVDVDGLLAELNGAVARRQDGGVTDPRTLSTRELVDYIVSRHHAYLREALPFIRTLAHKVARVHGDHEPRLVELKGWFDGIFENLLPHLEKEEQVLFPALLSSTPDAAVIATELAEMHRDHLEVGTLLEKIRQTTGDFAMPPWACNSYRTLFAELEQLEGDTLRHVHLENHVLMPRFDAHTGRADRPS